MSPLAYCLINAPLLLFVAVLATAITIALLKSLTNKKNKKIVKKARKKKANNQRKHKSGLNTRGHGLISPSKTDKKS
jgi:hypothetical protein